ncbi:hypothetical protein LEP1GSC036_2680 [Leptospira weilii str. 2006001853]|uniref:Uncharacterized protein n=3 Tax=Leptospira weilii TaxID=28184 RepID=A0A828Z4R9_9LEPT|nr:hypothetical protein LEP1GSC036_2680 [Leptospira weilii str. 2006001853]EMJ62777.1 hypothetical protein LEP1GSC051_1843 [Leptospira sp. P2653]EMM73304.1 hypothetical protein LEP1GSC038_2840 [Leptospira weilii str. 2006001855]EMN45093.1 hypothetical protein LEP1GSC086_2733 [Leptospira weilii str. LNT 1234]EMN91948.1 hypothetical protein LEP1GSC108_0588 [Leptospira weilii str. UI 13098]
MKKEEIQIQNKTPGPPIIKAKADPITEPGTREDAVPEKNAWE